MRAPVIGAAWAALSWALLQQPRCATATRLVAERRSSPSVEAHLWAPAQSGDVAVKVDFGAAFAAGDKVIIKGGGHSEEKTVKVVEPQSLVLDSTLANPYLVGASVAKAPAAMDVGPPRNSSVAAAAQAGPSATAADATQQLSSCSLLGGALAPHLSDRCCSSIQVLVQRALQAFQTVEPCPADWECEEDGFTPTLTFEEKAAAQLCGEEQCKSSVIEAMESSWLTSKHADLVTEACSGNVSSSEDGVVNAMLDEAGMFESDDDSTTRHRRRRANRTRVNYSNMGDTWCFPGESVVSVPGKEDGNASSLRMVDIRVGDEVLVEKSVGHLSFEPVLGFLHAAWGKVYEFLTVRHDLGEFRASPGHIIFVQEGSDRRDKPAAMLRVGDSVLAVVGGSTVSSQVLSISRGSTLLGMFAPLTASGTIVVDGVVASNYATPRLRLPVAHWLAHAIALPVRMYHRWGLHGVLVPFWALLCGADGDGSQLGGTTLAGAESADKLLCQGGGGAGRRAAGDELHPWMDMMLYGLRLDHVLEVASGL